MKKKWKFENPGIVVGFDKTKKSPVIGKLEEGDELWFIQDKFENGDLGHFYIYPIRNNHGVLFGIGQNPPGRGSCFTLSPENCGDL